MSDSWVYARHKFLEKSACVEVDAREGWLASNGVRRRRAAANGGGLAGADCDQALFRNAERPAISLAPARGSEIAKRSLLGGDTKYFRQRRALRHGSRCSCGFSGGFHDHASGRS